MRSRIIVYPRLTCAGGYGLTLTRGLTLIHERLTWRTSPNVLCSRSRNCQRFFYTDVESKNEPRGLIRSIDHDEICRNPFIFIVLAFLPGFSLDDPADASDFDLDNTQLQVTCEGT